MYVVRHDITRSIAGHYVDSEVVMLVEKAPII